MGLAGTLTVAMGVSTLMHHTLGALGPFLTRDLELSRAAFGALPSVLYAVGGALSPVAGPLVDSLGGRRALFALFATWGLAALAVAAAPSYPLLLAAVAFTGVVLALGNPATNSLLARHVPKARQGLVTGIKQSGVQMGAFVGGPLLPRLAGLVGWRGAVASTAGLTLVGLVAVAVTVPPTRGAGPRARGDRAVLGAEVNWLAVYGALMGAGLSVTSAFLPLYAVERLELSPATAGLVAGVVGMIGVVARVVLGQRADRSTLPIQVALGRLAVGAVAAVLLILAAETSGVALLWIGAALLGASAVAWNAVGMLSIIRGVEPAVAGRAAGRVLLGFYGGFVVSPIMVGFLIDRTGSYTLGWLVTALLFASAVVVATVWRQSGLTRVGRLGPAPSRPARQGR